MDTARLLASLALIASLALVVAVTGACSPTLSSLEPARTIPAGHVQITSGLDVSLPSGDIRDALESARDMDAPGGTLSAQDANTLVRAGTAVVVQPPSGGGSVSVAVGLSQRFALSLRASGNAARAAVRWQFLRVAPGFYGALGLGVSTYFYGFPVQQFVPDLSLDSFSRTELDIPLSFGWSGKLGHVWFGPKLVFSRYDARVTACLDRADSRCVHEATVAIDGTAFYFAGQLGAAIGWKRFWIAAELTVAYVSAGADVGLSSSGHTRQHRVGSDGIVLQPAIGFLVWI